MQPSRRFGPNLTPDVIAHGDFPATTLSPGPASPPSFPLHSPLHPTWAQLGLLGQVHRNSLVPHDCHCCWLLP